MFFVSGVQITQLWPLRQPKNTARLTREATNRYLTCVGLERVSNHNIGNGTRRAFAEFDDAALQRLHAFGKHTDNEIDADAAPVCPIDQL
jgi:hypothetical protein